MSAADSLGRQWVQMSYDGQRHTATAYEGPAVVGHTTYEVRDPEWHDAAKQPYEGYEHRSVSIHDINVHPERQRRGVGRGMVQAILDEHPGRKLRTSLQTTEGGHLFRDRGIRSAAAKSWAKRLP